MKTVLKKILVAAFIALAALTATSLTSTNLAYADPPDETPSASTSGADCRYFLGMRSWDCNVDLTGIHDEEVLTTSIWIIASNVLSDMTVMATYLALGFVIYGGYLYIFASGDPTKAQNGRKTLTRALIGLAVVTLSNLILNSIRIALLGNAGSFADNCASGAGVCSSESASEIITHLIQWFIGTAGVVAAIFVMIGGINYVTANGDPSKLQKAKTTITYALVGLAIVALAELITAWASSLAREAENTPASFIQTTLIAKETK